MGSYLERLANKRAMITGGLGFIGSNLAHRLVGLGAKVVLVDSLISGCGGNLFNISGVEDKVKVHIADMRHENNTNHLVRGQDYIFNLAGQGSHIDSMRDPYTDLELNCRSHLSILEACRKYNPDVKIVYASTRQIYGRPNYLPVDEGHPLHPTDVNGINKMAGELYHLLYHKVYGIRTTSLRLTNTYGPRMVVKHSRQTFLGWFIRLAIEGEEIPIFGDGHQKRDLTYIDDAVDAFLRAAADEKAIGQVFNLGGLKPISLLELTETLIEICGGGRYRFVPFPPERKRIDIGDFYADYSKITRTLGWRPTIPLREGLKRTVEFYRRYKEHYW